MFNKNITIKFKGPYKFTDIETCPYSKSEGVYLWTMKYKNTDKYLIRYIGETTSFARRQIVHLIHILGLNYGIYDVEKEREGIPSLIWRGMWRDKSDNKIKNVLDNYPKLTNRVIRYVNSLDLFFAEINIETYARKKFEGVIARELRGKNKENNLLYPDDNRVMITSKDYGLKINVESEKEILGLENKYVI